MIPASPGALAAVQGSYDFEILADIYHANGLALDRRYQDIALTEFNLNHDGGAEVQGTSSGGFVFMDPLGRSIAPRKIENVLAPTTTWMSYRLVLPLETGAESYRIGYHNVTGISDPSTSWEAMHDESIVSSQVFTFDAADAFVKTKRERFPAPAQALDRSSLWRELGAVVGWPAEPSMPDREVPLGMTYPTERMTAVYDLAKLLDGIAYMTPNGTVSVRPILPPRGAAFDLVPVTIDVRSDVWQADLVYNGVIVRSYSGIVEEGEDPAKVDGGEGDFGATLLGAAYIESGALRWGRPGTGAWGKIPYFASTPTVTTPQQATAYARAMLPKVSAMAAVGATIKIVPNPFLQVGDPVAFLLDNTLTRGTIVKIAWRNLTDMTLEVLCDQ